MTYTAVSSDYIECAEFARQNARVDAIHAKRRQEQERKAWEAERRRHAQEMRLVGLAYTALAVFAVGAALILAAVVV